jgi:hypothetical protein
MLRQTTRASSEVAEDIRNEYRYGGGDHIVNDRGVLDLYEEE